MLLWGQRALLLFVLFFPALGYTQDTPSTAPASPKNPWGNFEVVEEEEPYWLTHVLLYLPNRILDLIDTVHVDVGVGPAYGAVGRVTKWGQFGARRMRPGSVRVGNFGRQAPIMLEDDDEGGFGPDFDQSPKRHVCNGEVGVGLDIGLAGAYTGICLDEAFDFLAGFFLLDVMDDDLR